MGLETSMYNLTPPKHLTAHLLRIIVGELRPVRGARDFYPEDARLRSWLFSHFEEVSRIFAFEEYDAPIVESESLYTRKSGEEITDQIYNFEDKGGRRISLRPEMTPSLARLIIQKTPVLSFPLKWYSIPQCWRYERMTRGRKREHYQWNMDIIGVDNTSAEVELLSAIISLFKRLGLSKEDVGIRISNRKLLQELLTSIDTPEDQFSEICIVLDKMHKLSKEDIFENLSHLGLSEDASSQIFGMLEIPDISTQGTLSIRRWTTKLNKIIDNFPSHKEYFSNLYHAAFSDTKKILFVNRGVDISRPLSAQSDCFWWGYHNFSKLNKPYSTVIKIVRGYKPSLNDNLDNIKNKVVCSLFKAPLTNNKVIAGLFSDSGEILELFESK